MIASAAHKSENYLIDERSSVAAAWNLAWDQSWGSEPGSHGYHLYWDINISSGVISRGITPWVPVTGTQPTLPSIDQHWFDKSENVMKVWSGSAWVPKIRVFAGFVSETDVIESSVSSQVGLNGDCQ